MIYDPRGCGASTRQGPYDAETDAGDLLAVAEAAGGEALARRWDTGTTSRSGWPRAAPT